MPTDTENRDTDSKPKPERAARSKRLYGSAQARGTKYYERGRFWVDNVDPASMPGATVGWFKRYRAADGQLYAVLLSAYFFLTLVPLLIVETSYVYKNPDALATRIDRRLHLSGTTGDLVHSVLAGSGNHKFSATLLAIINLFFFGVGFGRVLQLVHARSWGLDLRKNALLDQGLYYGILAVLALMTFLYVLQTHALRNSPSWIGWLLDVGWLALLVGFFTWAPWLLLHRQVAWRNVLPGAVFTIVGFIGLRIISGLLLKNWLNWYSKTYGALGIVMAIFFWLVIYSTVLVLAAALSPALAHRRDLLRARLENL
jgi:membrane protein